MADQASTRQVLQVELEQEAAREQPLRGLLCLAGDGAAFVMLEWSAGSELTLNAALPPDRSATGPIDPAVLAERLEALGWGRLDEQTMNQDLTASHELPRDAADVVDRLVVALTEAYQVDVAGAAFSFEVLPPTVGESWRNLVERFTLRRRRT
jgi:hypothetical protein